MSGSEVLQFIIHKSEGLRGRTGEVVAAALAPREPAATEKDSPGKAS